MQEVVFVIVVAARFVLPMLIPRFPLPAILACLILDAQDQSIFQAFGYDPQGYQSYDKAMDIFYLSIAYLAVLRNWDNLIAVEVARFLFYYRMVGAFLFELSDERWLLLVFPNTFEYFFIAYELVRTRWTTRSIAARLWIVAAACIWIFVKLPQEFWLHVAKLDLSDTLRDFWWAWPLLISLLVLLAGILWFGVRPRLPRPDHDLALGAGPLPGAVDNSAARAVLHLAGGWVLSWMTVEKILLIGTVAVIYGQVLPGVTTSKSRLFLFIAVLVALNAMITVAFSRRRWTFESAGLSVLARLGVNIGLVIVVEAVLGRSADAGETFFFLCLISLMTTLHDRYQPIYAWRRSSKEPISAH